MANNVALGSSASHLNNMVSWEVVYDDNSVLREVDGAKYNQINRDRLQAFRLVSPGEIIIELVCRDGRNGRNLCYRRRTGIGQSGSSTWFVLGWVPMGPAYAVDAVHKEIYQAPAFSHEDKLLYPPSPIVTSGEDFTFSQKPHRSDAMIKPNRIILPSGYILDVPKGL